MMADNYKILGQDVVSDLDTFTGFNSARVAYETPANTQSAVSSISILNTGSIATEYSVGVIKQADVASVTQNKTAIKFLALGRSTSDTDPAYSAYSLDEGDSWTTFTLPGTRLQVVSAVQAQGKIFAIALTHISNVKDIVFYSEDGVTWSLTLLPTPAFWSSIKYLNGKFYAVGPSAVGPSSVIAESSDGISWSLKATIPGGFSDITYGNEKFVLGGNGQMAYSTDALSWTTVGVGSNVSINNVEFANGIFFAVNRYPNSYVTVYSTDGVVWSGIAQPGDQGYNLFYAYGKFFMIFPFSNGLYSFDPITFNYYLVYSGAQRAAYSNGNIMVYFAGNVSYSTDGGSTWDLRSNITLDVDNPFLTSIDKDVSEKTILTAQKIIPTRSIEPNTVDEIVGGITLSAGDQIRVYSESPDLIVQVYGVEIA